PPADERRGAAPRRPARATGPPGRRRGAPGPREPPVIQEPLAALREISPADPLLRGRSGKGVSIAVIDSGVNPRHPHVGGLDGGVAIADDGSEHGDLLDRLGHGTAVAAAIHEKAPEAEIHIARVFHSTLSTNVESLVQALDWAAGAGVRLVNLS